MEPLLLKAGDIAKLLGLGRSKVFAMLAVGALPVIPAHSREVFPENRCWALDWRRAKRRLGRRPEKRRPF